MGLLVPTLESEMDFTMATWIEIRCEKRGDGLSGKDRCWSDDNSGPMGMASDDQKSVLAVLKDLHVQAKASNWAKTREGWVCPVCSAIEQPN